MIEKTARARLFCEKDCDLKKAIETFRISESTYEQLAIIFNKIDIKEEIHATKTFQKCDSYKSHSTENRELTVHH